MKIIDRIEQINQAVAADNTGALGRALQELGAKAIIAGIGSPEWNNFMVNFRSNPEQLRRLNGHDPAFYQYTWAKTSLAYLVANSTCAETTTTRTDANMSQQMKDGLDSQGLPANYTPHAGGVQPLVIAPAPIDI